MNTHGKTRLICHLSRLRAALTGTRSSSHLSHCPDCQARLTTHTLIEHQLRTTAPRPAPTAPDDLAFRITQAVRQAEPKRPARHDRRLETFALLAGAAATIVLCLHLVRQQAAPRRDVRTPNVATSTADLGALVAGVDSLRTQLFATVAPTTRILTTEDPLSQEIASVQADARTALGFLALNFLPSESAVELESQLTPSKS